MKYYHASVRPLDVGTVLGGRTSKGPFGKRVEDLVESVRPKGYPARSTAVFMNDSPTDLAAGACFGPRDGCWVYEVKPLSKVVRVHSDWLEEMAGKRHAAREMLAEKYWSGDPWEPEGGRRRPPTWEYLTKEARVVRLVHCLDSLNTTTSCPEMEDNPSLKKLKARLLR